MFPLKLKWLRIFAFEQFVPYLSFEIVKRDKVLFLAWLICFVCTFISEPCPLSDKEILFSLFVVLFNLCYDFYVSWANSWHWNFISWDSLYFLVIGKHGNKIQLDSGTRLFLYQLVGTWGQLLFPKPWKEFRLWYDNNKAKGIKPFLDGMVRHLLSILVWWSIFEVILSWWSFLS